MLIENGRWILSAKEFRAEQEKQFAIGREIEKLTWLDSVLPETVTLTIRARGKDNEVETIKRILTFDEIKQGHKKIIQLLIEDTFLKIAAAKIISKLITNPHA